MTATAKLFDHGAEQGDVGRVGDVDPDPHARAPIAGWWRRASRAAPRNGSASDIGASAQRAYVSKTKDAAPGLDPTRLAVSVDACSPTVTSARVSISYPFAYDIPFLGGRTVTMTAAGVMRCGG